MSFVETSGQLPFPHGREMLAQRPPRWPPVPSNPAQPTAPYGIQTALLAFIRQVLLRPARIGALALLGVMTGVALVGAEGWWIVVGITLFQIAASTLTVLWVDLPQPGRAPPGETAGSAAGPIPDPVPQQRRPRPDE